MQKQNCQIWALFTIKNESTVEFQYKRNATKGPAKISLILDFRSYWNFGKKLCNTKKFHKEVINSIENTQIIMSS